jgi:hypothetical protein
MTDVTTSDYNDYTFDSIQDYFGEKVNAETLYEMSADQRQAFFEELYSEANLNETDLAEFEEAFEDELESLHDTLYIYGRQLEDMIESGSATSAEVATYELMLDDAQKMMNTLEDDVFDDWGDAITTYEEKNVDVDAGGSATINPSDPQNGDVYQATIGEGDPSSGSIFNTEENADWVDTTGDGYRETDPDTDNDGIADEDFDGDGAITEADLTYGHVTTAATVTISLNDGDAYEIIPGATADHVMFKVTQEDGTYYYIELNINSETKILIDQLPTNNLDTIPQDVLSMMYEKSSSASSFYEMHTGIDSTAEAGSYYSIYDLATTGNEAYIQTTDADFENGREYTINCDSNAADTITMNFPENAEIVFSYDADGNLILTVTSGANTINITISGLEYDSDGFNTDKINITGGNIITSSNYNTFEAFPFNETKGSSEYLYRGYLYSMIYYEGDQIGDVFEEAGYYPTYSWSSYDNDTGETDNEYLVW